MVSPKSTPTVSVCIPAYNEERNIGQILEYVRAEADRTPGIVEVLVDVSGSTDNTSRIASRIASTWNLVTVIDLGERDGLLRALDRLIRLAKGDIIIRMDADIHPAQHAFSGLVEALVDPSVGIAGGRVAASVGQSRVVNRLSSAEWELHHQVSLRHPKTTLLQAFWRASTHLPSDCGAEDVALQEEVEAAGRQARYVPSAVVSVMPPSSLPAMLVQRIRTVQQIRVHVGRGHPRPPTASPRIVTQAVAAVIRQREIPLVDLLGFLLVEGAARAWALFGSVVPGTLDFVWAPVAGTKDLEWGSPVERTGPVAERY